MLSLSEREMSHEGSVSLAIIALTKFLLDVFKRILVMSGLASTPNSTFLFSCDIVSAGLLMSLAFTSFTNSRSLYPKSETIPLPK